MKTVFIVLVFCWTHQVLAQEVVDLPTDTLEKRNAIGKLIDGLVFETSVYTNFFDSDQRFFNQNNSLTANFFIFNAGVFITKNSVLGLTTLDSKIEGKKRHIHQLYINYLFYNKPKFKLYYSHKLPANNWDEVNNNKFDYSRGGVGFKVRLRNTEKIGYFLDSNFDFIVSGKTVESRNEVLLIGLSLKFY